MARLWISFEAIHGFFTRSRTRVGDDGLVGKAFEQIDLRRATTRRLARQWAQNAALPPGFDRSAVGFFPMGKRQFCRSEAKLTNFVRGPGKNFLPAVPPNDRFQQSQTDSGILA